MRNIFAILIGVLIAAGFVVYIFSYTVKFTEVAVVSTFGSVDEQSTIEEPGLKFKWPAPIQSVTVYDRRNHVYTSQPESQQMADERNVVLTAFLTWRVSDPLSFYRSYRKASSSDAELQYREAEGELASRLRSALSEVSQYSLDDLLTTEAERSRLAELEEDIRANINGEGSDASSRIESTGVEVTSVGISKIELPSENTQAVFERMNQSRQKLVNQARSDGNGRRTRIQSEAQSARTKIMSFAETVAADIKKKGQQEARPYYEQLNAHPELAIFLDRLNLMERSLGRQLTAFLPETLFGPGIFRPDFVENFVENDETLDEDKADDAQDTTSPSPGESE